MEIIDNHTHLNDEPFRGKEQYYLERAKALDVTKVICAGQDPDFNQRAVDLAQKFDNVYAMVGYCPDVAKDYDQQAEDKLIDQLKQPKVVEMGEIGLDYYWDRSYNDVQKAVFEAQIEFAKKHDKPIIVHDREAHGDSLEILKRTNAAEVGVVMHCFSGSPEFALECVKEGFYIALGGVVTFKNAKKMKEVAKIVPLERLLLETDSPYLTPVPFRGKRNEPAYVKYAAEEIANLRGIGFEELARATTENAIKIFRLNEVQNG